MSNTPILGVIGGSGLYAISSLKDIETLEMNTPFGKPSAPLVVGTLNEKRVAFLARHGIGHTINPTEVNYRANIYAMKMLGVPQIVSISACGSLREDYAPGQIVIPDQVFDFTRRNRLQSFFGDGLVVHVGTANPYCEDLTARVYQAVSQTGVITHAGGTLITVEGPRFSTKAESNLFRSWGMSIIGMTACPEVFLAREAEICYVTLAHVTDYDVWRTSTEPVSVEMVVQTLNNNTHAAQQALENLVGLLPEKRNCGCGDALKDTIITNPGLIQSETRRKVRLLVDKYLPS
ncbi:S-methyl-5'-thioadenosine phosphorylase [Leptolinea tardivitalis]|uniref:S-methyl-5'-thioadenosine phosphorylase n=1 Tax=Leptolinea tardivitalis TaxID=229920 RepID=A0A0P6WS25_9CHLR|nr:S-methyl-5'-thioadenosine phosphorylase [Leptolinea tardivitalis]KPL71749.1 S-methyl-5'-thioadenosine phosphorylase [Leptolinea tardivitalis]GAP20117.1 methylthioadenosine phosphorylase [Leptolinea tardivitalis]